MPREQSKQTCWLLGLGAVVGLFGASILGLSSYLCRAGQPSPTLQVPTKREDGKVAVEGRSVDYVVKAVASSDCRFGLTLLRQIVQTNQNSNVILSPSSISTLLAMARLGSAGVTRERINEVLDDKPLNEVESARGHEYLWKSRREFDPDVSLIVANSLWAQRDFQFASSFVASNRNFFGAQLRLVDLADPGTLPLINRWASEETRGRIGSVIDEKIDPDSVLVLLNAISFQGKWSQKFERSRTSRGTFVTATGLRKPVAMMEQSGRYRHLLEEHFEAVSLPYGKGRLSLYLFLPKLGLRPVDFCNKLDSVHWNEWISRFAEMDGVVTLPRFRLEYGVDLRKSLTALGMGIAFDPIRADFSSLFNSLPKRPFLKKVEHKAVIEVNEEGTVAAGTTSATIGLEGARRFFRLSFDRPFFLAIRDNENGDLLFLGFVVDPV